MLLAFDIGNSDITIGLWNGQTWKHQWRIPSRLEQPELFFAVRIRDYFVEAAIAPDEVRTIVLSSVVPGLNERIVNVIRKLFSRDPLTLGPELYARFPIQVLNPYEIGSDLVANALAAYTRFRQACIVVDFGTALTFTTLSVDGKILGVSIVPGLRTAVKSLSQNTARLFDVPLEMPASALGKSTITAIQSGIVIGYDGLVRSVVQAIRAELKQDCIAVATGGLSFAITSLRGFFHTVDPLLTLDGLRIVGETFSEERPGMQDQAPGIRH
jgi:type III pantothenate kinase